MKMLCLCLLSQLCAMTMAKETILDTPIIRRTYRGYRNWLSQTYGTRNNEQMIQLQKENKFQTEVPADVPFPCNVTDSVTADLMFFKGGRSSNVPKSVHRLRPGDIDVIAAMGDSLTVSTAATAVSVLQLLVENRGISGSIGGQETWRKYLTFPNILKEFNPKLIGYSLGDSVSTHPDAQLNVGETGAMSEDMPFMAQYLVKKIKNDSRIDVNKDWKLISLMIGSNDFCHNQCEGPSPWSILKEHKIELINALRILRDNLPRTFVALIPPPYLKIFVEYHRQHVWLCNTMSVIECPCLFASKFQHQKLEYYEVMRRWQELEKEIASYPEFYRDDFTVEILPFLVNSAIPLAEDGYQDISYFAVDCFHFSQKFHARYANGIWNNLLEPADNRSVFIGNIFESFLCPTSKSPYLTTHKNRREINKARD